MTLQDDRDIYNDSTSVRRWYNTAVHRIGCKDITKATKTICDEQSFGISDYGGLSAWKTVYVHFKASLTPKSDR